MMFKGIHHPGTLSSCEIMIKLVYHAYHVVKMRNRLQTKITQSAGASYEELRVIVLLENKSSPKS